MSIAEPHLHGHDARSGSAGTQGRVWLLVATICAVGVAIFGQARLPELVGGTKLVIADAGLWTAVSLLFAWFLAYQRVASVLGAIYGRLVAIAGPPLERTDTVGTTERSLAFAFVVVAVALPIYDFVDQAGAVKLARENGPIESATAIFCFLAAIACLIYRTRAPRRGLFRLHTIWLALIFFVVGMEEISWARGLSGLRRRS